VAKGTNPSTGLPAFTKVSDGDFDHVKWMADTQRVASSGVPGVDAVPGKTLSCTGDCPLEAVMRIDTI
jgi:hypothetical protein